MSRNAGTTLTKVKHLDKHEKKFIYFSVAVIVASFICALILSCVYRFSSIVVYKALLLFIIVVTIITALAFVPMVLIIHSSYRRKHVSGIMLWGTTIGVRVLLPFFIFLTDLLKRDGDDLRRFYIELNNILVKSQERKYCPQQVLMLLPHCLQDSECRHRITNNIGNCRNCGKCCIGEIKLMAEDKGIDARIMTGGTLARNAVSEKKPDIILAVACERDMASGISDIKDIPVIGLINERPYGPCSNTSVDIGLFRRKLDEIIETVN